MIYKLLIASLIVVSSFVTKEPKELSKNVIDKTTTITSESLLVNVYNSLNTNHFAIPNFNSFSVAMKGYSKLKEMGKINNEFLTIVDYSLPSTSKRLWIIDTKENKIILNSLVAHGKNSGANYATRFSNKNESNKSSLGFFITGEAYIGKHGLSLRLDGLESGINDGARNRSIVMHAANYVSEAFIKAHNRLGLSHGCPALPENLSAKIIATIKGKSCLFIYSENLLYNSTSKLVS